jgi:carbon-monoxide dehydrogenase medium subunit
MKPSPFTYHRPTTVAEAIDLLGRLGSDAKVLAGGQSLVPILNMRLAAPAHLVDINHIDDLEYVRANDERVQVGATARHSQIEHDAAASRAIPLLRRALRHVAHPTIRNRGTTVGSLVHADPSGEMPAVLTLLGGSVTVVGAQGSRTISATDFFVGPLESSLAEGELATSATFPTPPRGHGSAFVEVSRRHGDYAVCGLGAIVVVDDDLCITSATASYVSAASTPVVVDLTDAAHGMACDKADWPAAGRLAQHHVEPEDDIHATATFRRHLVAVLTARALSEAAQEATRLTAQESSA